MEHRPLQRRQGRGEKRSCEIARRRDRGLQHHPELLHLRQPERASPGRRHKAHR